MKKSPQRMCGVCRQHKDKNQMVRVVRTKDGDIFVDKTQKIEGRGAYICLDDACIESFLKTKFLNRSFKCEIPQAIYDKLREELYLAKSANK